MSNKNWKVSLGIAIQVVDKWMSVYQLNVSFILITYTSFPFE